MNQILKAIECCKCQRILNIPILLPCSHAICKSHVDEATSPIRCDKCGEEHEIPRNGFTRIEALEEIIKTEIGQSNLAVVYQEAYDTCQAFDEYISSIENMIQDPLNLAQDELNEIRNSALLAGEELKLKIDNEVGTILDKIERHKTKYLTRFNAASNQYKDDMNKLTSNLNEAKNQLTSWNNDLKKFTLNEANCKNVKSQSKVASEKLKSSLDSFKKKILSASYSDIKLHIQVLKNSKIEEYKLEIDSKILNSELFFELKNLLSPLDINKDNMILLYRGSRDGFGAAGFHEKCDREINTLTVIKSTSDHVFGAYASRSWKHFKDSYLCDEHSFIFSLVNTLNRVVKCDVKASESGCALYYGAQLGPTFGQGYDLMISDMANLNKKSYSRLGRSYQLPPDLVSHGETFLAGSRKFTVAEIEVFRWSPLPQSQPQPQSQLQSRPQSQPRLQIQPQLMPNLNYDHDFESFPTIDTYRTSISLASRSSFLD